MKNPITTPEVTYKTYALLKERFHTLLPWGAALFLLFGLANLARGVFPGIYVFDPFDQGWLLIPEALVFGPVIALMTHRILAPETTFSWSRDNLLVKLGKAAAYFYVLLILFKVGFFAVTQAIPALFGYVLGPSIGPLFPIIMGCGCMLFLILYVRLALVYPALAGQEREPLIQSMFLTKRKGVKLVSCLLLLIAPVLIPWVAASVYAGDWFDPTVGGAIKIVPILARSVLQAGAAILISAGACVLYEALVSESEAEEKPSA